MADDVLLNKAETIEKCNKKLDLDIVEAVIQKHLADFQDLTRRILQAPGL